MDSKLSLWNYILQFTDSPSIQTIARKYLSKKINDFNSIIQSGGKTKKYSYMGYTFSLDISRDGDMINVSIYTNEDNPIPCATVLINDEHIGAMQTISFFPECMNPPYPSTTGGGSLILRFILEIMRAKKHELKIRQLTLQDNSDKSCSHCKNNVNLSDMYFLIHGNTWYGKYGFRPCESEGLYDAYAKNQEIINNAVTSDVPLYRYISTAVSENNLQNINVISMKKYIDSRQDKSLMETLRTILIDYNKNCCLFTYIAPRILHELNMQSFHRQLFYLNL